MIISRRWRYLVLEVLLFDGKGEKETEEKTHPAWFGFDKNK